MITAPRAATSTMLLKAQLADLGFTDIDVKVSEGGVAFNAEDDKATVGISDAQGKTNGDVTFFYIEPRRVHGLQPRPVCAAPTWRLSCRARARRPSTISPSKAGAESLGTRISCAADLLDEAAEQVAIGYACGRFGRVRYVQNLTLPYTRRLQRASSAVELDRAPTAMLCLAVGLWLGRLHGQGRRALRATATVTLTADGYRSVERWLRLASR